MTLFDPSDPYVTFEIKPTHNVCDHSHIDACDQVW